MRRFNSLANKDFLKLLDEQRKEQDKERDKTLRSYTDREMPMFLTAAERKSSDDDMAAISDMGSDGDDKEVAIQINPELQQGELPADAGNDLHDLLLSLARAERSKQPWRQRLPYPRSLTFPAGFAPAGATVLLLVYLLGATEALLNYFNEQETEYGNAPTRGQQFENEIEAKHIVNASSAMFMLLGTIVFVGLGYVRDEWKLYKVYRNFHELLKNRDTLFDRYLLDKLMRHLRHLAVYTKRNKWFRTSYLPERAIGYALASIVKGAAGRRVNKEEKKRAAKQKVALDDDFKFDEVTLVLNPLHDVVKPNEHKRLYEEKHAWVDDPYLIEPSASSVTGSTLTAIKPQLELISGLMHRVLDLFPHDGGSSEQYIANIISVVLEETDSADTDIVKAMLAHAVAAFFNQILLKDQEVNNGFSAGLSAQSRERQLAVFQHLSPLNQARALLNLVRSMHPNRSEVINKLVNTLTVEQQEKLLMQFFRDVARNKKQQVAAAFLCCCMGRNKDNWLLRTLASPALSEQLIGSRLKNRDLDFAKDIQSILYVLFKGLRSKQQSTAIAWGVSDETADEMKLKIAIDEKEHDEPAWHYADDDFESINAYWDRQLAAKDKKEEKKELTISSGTSSDDESEHQALLSRAGERKKRRADVGLDDFSADTSLDTATSSAGQRLDLLNHNPLLAAIFLYELHSQEARIIANIDDSDSDSDSEEKNKDFMSLSKSLFWQLNPEIRQQVIRLVFNESHNIFNVHVMAPLRHWLADLTREQFTSLRITTEQGSFVPLMQMMNATEKTRRTPALRLLCREIMRSTSGMVKRNDYAAMQNGLPDLVLAEDSVINILSCFENCFNSSQGGTVNLDRFLNGSNGDSGALVQIRQILHDKGPNGIFKGSTLPMDDVVSDEIINVIKLRITAALAVAITKHHSNAISNNYGKQLFHVIRVLFADNHRKKIPTIPDLLEVLAAIRPYVRRLVEGMGRICWHQMVEETLSYFMQWTAKQNSQDLINKDSDSESGLSGKEEKKKEAAKSAASEKKSTPQQHTIQTVLPKENVLAFMVNTHKHNAAARMSVLRLLTKLGYPYATNLALTVNSCMLGSDFSGYGRYFTAEKMNAARYYVIAAVITGYYFCDKKYIIAIASLLPQDNEGFQALSHALKCMPPEDLQNFPSLIDLYFQCAIAIDKKGSNNLLNPTKLLQPIVNLLTEQDNNRFHFTKAQSDIFIVAMLHLRWSQYGQEDYQDNERLVNFIHIMLFCTFGQIVGESDQSYKLYKHARGFVDAVSNIPESKAFPTGFARLVKSLQESEEFSESSQLSTVTERLTAMLVYGEFKKYKDERPHKECKRPTTFRFTCEEVGSEEQQEVHYQRIYQTLFDSGLVDEGEQNQVRGFFAHGRGQQGKLYLALCQLGIRERRAKEVADFVCKGLEEHWVLIRRNAAEHKASKAEKRAYEERVADLPPLPSHSEWLALCNDASDDEKEEKKMSRQSSSRSVSTSDNDDMMPPLSGHLGSSFLSSDQGHRERGSSATDVAAMLRLRWQELATASSSDDETDASRRKQPRHSRSCCSLFAGAMDTLRGWLPCTKSEKQQQEEKFIDYLLSGSECR